MYKLLLCLRYLRTRYIALASIISVTLGVATMIVVNSVMAGFSHEMRDRIHGILADVILEANDMQGAQHPAELMARIDQVAGEYIEAMSPTVEIYGMLTLEFMYSGKYITRPVTLVGIDPQSKGRVGPLKEYLESYQPLVEDGVQMRPAARTTSERLGWELTKEALDHRRRWRMREQFALDHTHIPHAPADGPFGTREPIFESGADSSVAPTAAPTDHGPRATDHSAALADSPPFGAPPPFAPQTTDPDAPVEAPRPDNHVTELPPDAGAGFVGNPFESDDQDAASPWDQQNGQAGIAADFAAPREGRLYVGLGLISYLEDDPQTGQTRTRMMVHPGDDVRISTVTAGGDRAPPKATHDFATIVDVFKSGMSEYDSNLVYCNLEWLQKVRGMLLPDQTGRFRVGQSVNVKSAGRDLSGHIVGFEQDGALVVVDLDPAQPVAGQVTVARSDVSSTVRSITSIQIKLKNFEDAPEVVKRLQAAFPAGWFSVRTWEQKQGPLLAAVEVESAILNVLLFLIIAVAGFGILAIFFMIVVEKTRDIGILKALGASSSGVMSIFLSYGLALGVVGSGVGVVLGLLFVRYINTIEGWLTWVTGRKVFDEKIYYFPEIPTSVSPLMVVWVAAGAMAIAVLASVLPARRAARLHPVRALRYE